MNKKCNLLMAISMFTYRIDCYSSLRVGNVGGLGGNTLRQRNLAGFQIGSPSYHQCHTCIPLPSSNQQASHASKKSQSQIRRPITPSDNVSSCHPGNTSRCPRVNITQPSKAQNAWWCDFLREKSYIEHFATKRNSLLRP
jgi:hypothetical protein